MTNWRAAHCIHCAMGKPLLGWPGWHEWEDGGKLCTAPTPEQYIAQLEARLEMYVWLLEQRDQLRIEREMEITEGPKV